MKELDKTKEYYIKLTSQEDLDISINYLKIKGYKEYSDHITNKQYDKKYPILMISNDLDYYTRDTTPYYEEFEEILISDLKETGLKSEDLVKGKWYYLEARYKWIFKFDGIFQENLCHSKTLCIDSMNYYNSANKLEYTKDIKNLKEATKEEVLKYFPDEKFEDVDEDLEYVKCLISEKDWINKFTVGKIYKKNMWSTSTNISLVSNLGSEEVVYLTGVTLSFERSNKEAFDKQNIKQETSLESKFIIGKWYNLKYNLKGKYLSIYVKVKEFKENKIYFDSERYINSDGKYDTATLLEIDRHLGNFSSLEVSLEEIQHYLPEGHIDKIKPKTMETKLSKEELLAEAKRRYPINSKIRYLSGGGKDIILGNNFQYYNNNLITASSYSTKQILYKDGIWAEIISLPESKSEEFKVGDFIICLKDGKSLSKGEKYYKDKIYSITHVFTDGTIGLENYSNVIYKIDFRKALEHEIPKESKSVNLDNFPEKWCIRGSIKNQYVLKHYFENFTNKWNWDYNSKNTYYFVNDGVSEAKSIIPEGYKEITFDQFKAKFIDKQEPVINTSGFSFEDSKVNSLVEGEYYYHIGSGNLVKWGKSVSAYYLGNKCTKFEKGNGHFDLNIDKYRKAYFSERSWLDACINANRFISFEQAISKQNSVTIEESYPKTIQLLSKPKLIPIKIESESKISIVKQLKTIKI